MSEVRHALRRLHRRPVRGLAAVVTLALGIGGSTAAFSALRGVLLRPLPVSDQAELLVAWTRDDVRGFDHVPLGPRAFETARRALTGGTRVGGFDASGARPTPFQAGGTPGVINHVRVAGDFFTVLGARPAAGRLLDAADDVPGAAPVVVLSHGYWLREHGGDPAVVGSRITYAERTFTVAGVAPEGFDFPRGTDLWASLRALYPEWASAEPVGVEMDLVLRRPRGEETQVTLDRVDAALRADPELAEYYATVRTVGVPFFDHTFGTLEPVLTVIMVAGLALLAAALANTLLLLLAGGRETWQDMGVRTALGATQRHLAARLMSDVGVVAAFGGVLGLALAGGLLAGLVPLAPAELPRLDEVRLDGWGVAFALSTVALTLSATAGAAALISSRSNVRALLGSGRPGGVGGSAFRRSLAAVQVAFAVLVAVGAGLLVRSVAHLRGLEPGFDVEGLSVVALTHPHELFAPSDGFVERLERASRALEAVPGVTAATPAVNYPLSPRRGMDVALRLEGQSMEDVRENPYVSFEAVLPGYFGAMGMRLIEGRALTPEDGTGARPVAVVTRSAAAAYWPGEAPLGRVFNLPFPGYEGTWWEVVGVMEDTRYRAWVEPRAEAFLPLAQMQAIPPSRFLVRTEEGAPPVRDLVTEAFAEHVPEARVLSVEPVGAVLQRPLAGPRFGAWILLGFAGLTLLLSVSAIYGVFSMLVQERAVEMGVRRALGAGRSSLASLVVGGVVRVAAVGTTVGLLASAWAGGLLTAVLYGVEPVDAPTMAVVAVGAMLVAVLGGSVPALKAARVDPAEALRDD